ncbi:patatin [Mycobacterium sp. djl-10]|nr:patatin [Mycobacterium sp. djl-10]
MTRALVLAGGGLAGIAWETGVLLGISDEAPDIAAAVLDSEVLVGTSAGSTVAAQISSGVALQELFERQLAGTVAEIEPGVSIDELTALFLSALADSSGGAQQHLRRIGAVAAAADTVPAASRHRVIADRLPSHRWPARVLRLTAVDIDSGEMVVFDRSSGVALVDAVAASCAVPGAWPPVPIAGRRYMDGGVASTVNIAVASDCDAVLVLVPAPPDAPSPFGAGAGAEIRAFPADTLAVFADDDAMAAFGPDPLDPRCRRPAALAGREQGRRCAEDVARFLRRQG